MIPVILLFFIIRIFKKFKINKIISHKIGHFTYPIEIYICEKNDPNKTPIIWFLDKTISNEFIKEQWKQKLIILPRDILEPIYILFTKFKFFSFFVLDYSKESEAVKRCLKGKLKQLDDKDVLLKYEPSIKFNKNEKIEGDNFLKKIGLHKNKFFLFASRSSSFHREKFESVRNSNINNQISAVRFLVSKGYKAVRLGKNEINKINLNDPNIIDYSTSVDRSDFLDVYLASKCEFMISSNSGINELVVLFRKPRLIIDFLYIPGLEMHYLNVMILLKKFQDIKTGKIITYEEAFEKKLSYMNTSHSKMNEIGYKIIDNSALEIRNAAENMFDLINNNFNYDKILDNQKRYWNNVEKYFGFKNKTILLFVLNFTQII